MQPRFASALLAGTFFFQSHSGLHPRNPASWQPPLGFFGDFPADSLHLSPHQTASQLSSGNNHCNASESIALLLTFVGVAWAHTIPYLLHCIISHRNLSHGVEACVQDQRVVSNSHRVMFRVNDSTVPYVNRYSHIQCKKIWNVI